jgi:CPA2 family monovalent cation:H+ antiporter-2
MDGLIRDLVLVLLLAGGVLHVARRARVPALVGLLIAGALVGPRGIAAVKDEHQIAALAEVGLVLLMFSIGLDFTRERLRELFRLSGLGILQMLICIVVTALVSRAFVDRWTQATLLGFLVAHSSSMLMLRVLIDRGQLRTPQGRACVGITITQDLAVVPMLVAVPLMAERQGLGGVEGGGAAGAFGLQLLRAAFALVAVVVLARWVIPFWLHHVIRARSRELFLIFIFVVSVGTAWVATEVGLPVSLGAFLAGLAVAGSGYADQMLAEVVPFRDLLVSIFFISIGMLLNLGNLPPLLAPAALIVTAVVLLKFASGAIPVLIWRLPVAVAISVGVLIAQIGEFSFVLAHTGRLVGLLPDELFQMFITVSILTMLLCPVLFSIVPSLTRWADGRSWLNRLDAHVRRMEPPPETATMHEHVVVAGCGLNGRNVVQTLRALGLPHVALDFDPEVVADAKMRGDEVMYGDCTRLEMLHRVNVKAARVYIVAVSDPQAARQTVALARRENPSLYIIARTKLVDEIQALRNVGADDVIAEEFETSLEIIARTLHAIDVSRLKIEQILQEFRQNAYMGLRRASAPVERAHLWHSILSAIDIEVVDVPGDSPVVGKTLRELDLRSRVGATLLAVQRQDRVKTIPSSDFRFLADDMLILAGTPRQLHDAKRLIAPAGVPVCDARSQRPAVKYHETQEDREIGDAREEQSAG